MRTWLLNKSLAVYFYAVFICLIFMTWSLKLVHANLRIPFSYSEDGVFSSVAIKGLIENGWIFKNSHVGAPYGQNLYDFPSADSLNYFVLKCISLISNDYAVVLNLFYLLGFPLTTITSVYVMRKFNVSNVAAIFSGILFTFMPFHFYRGEAHLFLAAYYLVPLIIMVTLWLFEELPFKTGNIFAVIKKRRFLFALVICVLVSSSGVYYAFYSCLLISIGGISATIQHKKLLHFFIAGLLVLSIGFGVFCNLLPTKIYDYYNGKNTEVAQRDTSHSEILGLRVTQLLLPLNEHRIDLLARLKAKYTSTAPFINENSFSTLGTVGALGFMILICWILFNKFRVKFDSALEILGRLSQLNILLLLLATMGGFGTLFSLIVTPEIRAYNRTSIFIGFICLFAIAIVYDKYVVHRFKKYKKAIMFVTAIMLLGALLDQTNYQTAPNYSATASEYNNDDLFVKKIESVVPKSSMIFQLPYVSFPEHPPVENMGGYELFRPYLHSESLVWSFGGMKGRESDLWQREIMKRPLADIIETVSRAGFNGIYINRNGYKDKGLEIETNITKLLGENPVVSENQVLSFYDLTNYNQALKTKETSHYPLVNLWGKGFYGEESTENKKWYWSSYKGGLTIINDSKKEKKFSFTFDAFTISNEDSQLIIKSDLFTDTIQTNDKGTHYSKVITIPHGNNLINFISNAKRIKMPNDGRSLVFRIENPTITELP